MTERQILFSAPMVRAIIEGRKTQTRRVVKSQPPRGIKSVYAPITRDPGNWQGVARDDLIDWYGRCPYGIPGDRLWVRHAAALFPVYFKPIPGWEGLYAAGTDGLVYRMDRSEPAALSGSPTSKGYLTVSLSRGKWETHAVHKIICETFYGPAPFEGAQVRHMDGNQANNHPENLDWGTQEDNWKDRKAHGRGMGGEHHASKLTPAMVEAIRASKASQRALARQYGVSQSTIQEARAGKTWAQHEPGARNLPAFKMWKPSIHMPRWACRLVLEVTAIRVERLQEISESDAFAEGIRSFQEARGVLRDDWHPRKAYAELWDSLNAKRGFGWAVNPWVWVIEFKRTT